MDSFSVALGSAIWLGILTSISPCPLATNIAAISYISKRVDRPGLVLIAGLMYTLGRMAAYIALGVIVVSSVLSVPEVATFLQQNMNLILGPLLIVVGVILLGLIKLNFSTGDVSDKLTKRVEQWGLGGAFALGVLFALSLCPISAALFFGSLIPLAIEQQSSVIMPTVYGLGTALPVVLFAILVGLGAKFVGTAFNKITQFEKYARWATGAVFILVGIYYSLIYLVGLDI